MAIRREAKSELGHDLVDSGVDSPKLNIRIHERPVEVRVNQSIAEWETEETEIEGTFNSGIQGHLDKVSWETLALVGGGLMGLVIFTIGGKRFIKALRSS